ncbi:ABC transporter permease [Terrihabitans rhizophilus]|uniref:ABC transporter permease n=1 Tax=Terrihabitans rhizophilus TaxID=3092662 RepID=A0ABU4RIW6_9HYPH|nr:ABC transporter permease [Terrihabitans sp. PJ23]MDX6804784.1 ABC transporter permease [Terrihabitans sp. PJ23]
MHGALSPAADALASEVPPAPQRHQSYLRVVFGRFLRQPIPVIAAVILLAIILAAVGADLVAPHDPFQTRVSRRLAAIGTSDRLLGGDELGRDVLTRLIYGGRISLTMAIVPVAIGLFIGGFLGILAGYAGGRVNMAIMRAMDVFYAFPSILLAVAIAGALGPGLVNGILALSLVFIPPIARMAESVTTQVRGYEYVVAARLSGASTVRILREHVLSNVAGPILVFSSSQVSVSIIAASGLSFLGLGVSPPLADWGLMLSALRQSIYVNPWVAALPGAMIFITSMSFNLVSDGVRKSMEVRR